MTKWKQQNPVRDEDKAQAILAEAAQEWLTVKSTNGNKRQGWNIRHRNRLMGEAGYDHNDAYYAVLRVERPDFKPIRPGS